MEITVLTLFPNFFAGPLKESIIKRAIEKSLLKINIVDIRDFATGNYKSVDDKPYGGGVGMVMKAEILSKAANSQKNGYKIFLTPKGKLYDQEKAIELSKKEHLILVCGHYEGVDQRFIDRDIDEEISIGDYVLTGGEIPSLVLIDSIGRLVNGVLKKEEATKFESFQVVEKEGKVIRLLEHPQYTTPQEWKGRKVPEILLSGNHASIDQWRKEESLKETQSKRPDLLRE